VIALAAAIVASVATGIAVERRFRESAHRAARLVLGGMLYTLVPFIIFFNIARLHVDVNVGAGLALGVTTLLTVGGLAYVVGTRVLKLDRRSVGALMASVMQVNTGYVGIPLIAALLGADQIGRAAAFDALVTAPTLFLAVFAVGAAFGDKAGEGWRERLRNFFTRNPPLFAVIAALIAPDSLAPDTLVSASHVLVYALVPLGFFAVGVTLAEEAEDGSFAFPPPLTPPVGVALGLRLLVAPAVIFLLSLPLIHLPAPYLIQAAMPSGINSLVVAHAYGLDLKICSAAIAWSTGLVVAAGLVGAAVT
jgi:predicted permease